MLIYLLFTGFETLLFGSGLVRGMPYLSFFAIMKVNLPICYGYIVLWLIEKDDERKKREKEKDHEL